MNSESPPIATCESIPPKTAPYEAAHWDLTPGGTVLVVIDPQNDFCTRTGGTHSRASTSSTCSG